MIRKKLNLKDIRENIESKKMSIGRYGFKKKTQDIMNQ